MNIFVIFLFAYCTWTETAIAGHIKDAEAIRSNDVDNCSSIIECPAVDGSDSVYGPLEDCTKFCQCSNGIASVHNCPRDLHFNPMLNVCDYPDKAGCDNSDISDYGNNDGDNGDNSGNSKEQSSDGKWKVGNNTNGCKIECPLVDGPDSVYGSLDDCTKFCQCSNGVVSIHNCPSDLHFNSILKVCDYPDKAGCSVGDDISDGGNNDGDNGDNISGNSKEKSSDEKWEVGNNTSGCKIECPLVDGPDSVYGSLDDCTKFCQCSNGVVSVHNCPSDLHFNSLLNVCDYPDRAGCSVGDDISDDGNNDGDNGDNISGVSEEKSSDEKWEVGNNTSGCKIECPLVDGPDSVYGSLDDCTKFCQCSNGVVSVHNCPSDLHFNSLLNVCDYPDRAGCSVGDDISDDGNNDGDNGDNISGVSEEKSSDEKWEVGNNTSGCKIECPLVDGPDSVYGSLDDCTKFCQCSNGVVSVHNCPSDLHFNSLLNVCDYPDRAGCSVGDDISDDGNNDGDNGDNSGNSKEQSNDGKWKVGNNTSGCKIECPLVDGPDSVYGSLDDCTKFCQCSNGVVSVHNCPSDLHFNSLLNVCDYPDRAGCNVGINNSSDRDISDERDNDDGNGNRNSNSDEKSGGSGEDGNNSRTCKIECPLVDGPDSVYGALEDCTKFCQCTNGIAYVHSCPRGLHFNPSLNICDHPDVLNSSCL